jgi:hypothetical protein
VSRSLLVTFLLLTACGGDERSSEPSLTQTGADGRVSVPASVDVGERCADVGLVRACWTEAAGPRCEQGVCLVPRAEPPWPAAGGWRCAGVGDARSCVARERGASAMVCDGDACEQRHPYLPDHGQWECHDDHGLAICRRLAEAAGVHEAPMEAGWTCAERGGPEGGLLCVDASPDRPEGEGWSCRYDHESGERRRCRRDPSAKVLGGECDSTHGCPRGAVCVESTCLPLALELECWIDSDCDFGECVLGRCSEAR